VSIHGLLHLDVVIEVLGFHFRPPENEFLLVLRELEFVLRPATVLRLQSLHALLEHAPDPLSVALPRLPRPERRPEHELETRLHDLIRELDASTGQPLRERLLHHLEHLFRAVAPALGLDLQHVHRPDLPLVLHIPQSTR